MRFRDVFRIGEFLYRFRMMKKTHLNYLPYIKKPIVLVGEERISIGKGFAAKEGVRLETYTRNECERGTNPLLIIGDNVFLNYRSHIGAINKVQIGNGVLIGSDVTVLDHNHGNPKGVADLQIPPSQRPLFSKGPIIVGDNVWLGDKVCVLPGVTIGTNSIIGAGSVVTNNIPENSIAVGNPAHVVKVLE